MLQDRKRNYCLFCALKFSQADIDYQLKNIFGTVDKAFFQKYSFSINALNMLGLLLAISEKKKISVYSLSNLFFNLKNYFIIMIKTMSCIVVYNFNYFN